jgi:hypothetical protein
MLTKSQEPILSLNLTCDLDNVYHGGVSSYAQINTYGPYGLVETRHTRSALTLLVAGLAQWVRYACDRWQEKLLVCGR